MDKPTLAPPLRLRDYLGRKIDLRSYRGRAVLVTFIYTHCTDTCPLIVGNLPAALTLLGSRASKVQILAVSTDPNGDTPAAIRGFLARHEMLGRIEYLVGSRRTLVPVWRAWGINVSHPTDDDQVFHTSLVYAIDARGVLMEVYPAHFDPSEIAHDIPILASN